MSCGAIALPSNDEDVIGYHSSENRKSVHDLSLVTSIVGTINKAMVYKLQMVTGIMSSFRVQNSLVAAFHFVHSPNPTMRV